MEIKMDGSISVDNNNIEKFEADKCDTEIIIQELHSTSESIENLRDNQTNSIIKLKLNSFIKELSKEIEWNEMILQELNDSINFVMLQKDK